MKETWNFDRCVSVLNSEIELIKKISAAQALVRQAVMKREWANFEERMYEVNRLGEEFAILEETRAALFAALSPEEKPFYDLITTLPPVECRELSRLYRELRVETFKMRAINETFLSYLSEVKTLSDAYIEALCPARGSKMYTRKGCKVSQDLRSIVINNRF